MRLEHGPGLPCRGGQDTSVLALDFVRQGDLLFKNLVRRLDIRAEWGIGEDDIEAALENAIDIEEAVVVVHAAVAVAVHDHIHLAGAGHPVVGISAVDTAVGEVPQREILRGYGRG